MSEKKKHLTTKKKKLEKSIKDDGHARSEAVSNAESQEEIMDSTRNKLDELEHKLVTDESDLERIRDSLRDKTDKFTQEIENKQIELGPWTTKINEKQSAIDVAQSEKSVLEGKATGVTKMLEEAVSNFESLDLSFKGKVSNSRDKHVARALSADVRDAAF